MEYIVPLYVDFSGILYSTYLTLPREVTIKVRQYFFAMGVSMSWWWKMLVGYIRRKRYYFAKNGVFFDHILNDCPNEKEIDILLVYHYVFVKLGTNILGLLWFALICIHNKTRTGLCTSYLLQSRGVIPSNCYEFTIRHWITERFYSHGL